MMNDEWRIWRGFLENTIIFFSQFSIFSHSPFLQFSQTTKLFLSFPSRSALIRVYLRQKNPFLFSIFSFPQLSSSFLFQTAKLLRIIEFPQIFEKIRFSANLVKLVDLILVGMVQFLTE